MSFLCKCQFVGWLICLWGMSATVFAQSESSDSIHISSSFMKVLEGAFEFAPMPDTIRYRDEFLTREQLHEWVGEVDGETEPSRDSLYLDPRFLGLSIQPTLPMPLVCPDFSKEINMWKSKNGRYCIIRTYDRGTGTAISGLDVKTALSNLLLPKYRKIHKMRKMAEDSKVAMDAAFPIR